MASSRSRYRELQRASFLGGRPDKLWNPPPAPPEVGETMTGRDLFLLEMWQLPVVCSAYFEDDVTAAEIWDTMLTEAQKGIWNALVKKYIDERSNPKCPYSFKAVRPWWLASKT